MSNPALERRVDDARFFAGLGWSDVAIARALGVDVRTVVSYRKGPLRHLPAVAEEQVYRRTLWQYLGWCRDWAQVPVRWLPSMEELLFPSHVFPQSERSPRGTWPRPELWPASWQRQSAAFVALAATCPDVPALPGCAHDLRTLLYASAVQAPQEVDDQVLESLNRLLDATCGFSQRLTNSLRGAQATRAWQVAFCTRGDLAAHGFSEADVLEIAEFLVDLPTPLSLGMRVPPSQAFKLCS